MKGTDQHVFDFAQVFSEDFAYFYSGPLGGQRLDNDVHLALNATKVLPGGQLLDIGCGTGRLSVELCRHSIQVTAFDNSRPLLDIARTKAEEAGADIEFVLGDMRQIPWVDRFDAAIAWFTVFGYFSDDQNFLVLKQVLRSLKPGGRLAIETRNWDRIPRDFEPLSIIRNADDFLLDENSYDPISGRQVSQQTVVRGGRVMTRMHSIRRYTYCELRTLLLLAGFERVDALGPMGAPLQPSDGRMVCVATAPENGRRASLPWEDE